MATPFSFSHTCALVGGLALFLYGMERALEPLRQARRYPFRAVVRLAAGSSLAAALAGLLAAVSLQGSAAISVLLIGLVEGGVLTLRQAMAVILGAGVGTAVTAHLIAFDLGPFALVLLAAGFLVRQWRRGTRWRWAGNLLMGLGFVFYGMHLLRLGAEPLGGSAHLARLFAAAEAPILLFLLAALLTALLQSATATLGLAMALATTSASGAGAPPSVLLPVQAVFPIVMGASVGTSATAWLASLRASRRGRQVALAHLLLKVAGVALFVPLIAPGARLVAGVSDCFVSAPGSAAGGATARAVANAQTLFALVCLGVLLPAVPLLARGVGRLLPVRQDAFAVARHLDAGLLKAPDLALAAARREVADIGAAVLAMSQQAREAFLREDAGPLAAVAATGEEVARRVVAVTRYLTEVATDSLTPAQAAEQQALLYIARDLAYIADEVDRDVGGNVARLAGSGASLSVEGTREVLDFWREIEGNLEATLAAFARRAAEAADPVLEYERQIEHRREALWQAHLRRLRAGIRATEETATLHMNLVSALRKLHYFIAHLARKLRQGLDDRAERDI